MKQSSYNFLFCAIITASISTSGFAQNGLQAIEEITVTSNSRQSEGLADINAAVSVITRDELAAIAHTHAQEALNRLPGVSIHRNNGRESLTAIRSPVLTGAGACGAFLIAENGIPVRSNGFCNVNEMFDTHSENAERVEVVRGPGSAFWGSNAVHGLINVVLPKAGDAGALTVEQGPWGSKRVKTQIGKDYGNFKQLLLLNGVNEQGYRENSGVDQQKLSWLYNYTSSNGWDLDGGFSYLNLNQETAGYIVGSGSYEGDGRDGNPNPEAYRDSVNGRIWTSFSKSLGNWDVVITPYAREVNMNFMQHFLPGKPIEDTYHRSIGTQSAFYKTLASGAEFAIGFDIEGTDGKLMQFQPNPTVGSFFLRNHIPQGKHYGFTVKSRQLAAFVNYEQNLTESLRLSLGLRAEEMDYEYDNLMLDGRTNDAGIACRFGCRYSRPSDRSDNFTNLSPKLGLSYAISENYSLQFRAQRGFRAPQATELYRLQNTQTVADLSSVELDSYEFEFKGTGINWNYSVSIYSMDKDNEIMSNSSRTNLNGNATSHRGAEFGAGIDLSSILSLAGTFNFADHSYENPLISGEINIKGKDVDTAPDQFGNLRLKWTPTETLSSEMELVHMGDYFTNPENTAKYDGHDVVNLRTQYEANESFLIYVNIMNLFDEEYAERADWTTFAGDRYFPGEPLRAYLGFTYKYR